MPNKAPVATGTETSSDPIRDNAVGLFRYLRDLAELRAKNVRDVASYELTFWFSELPCENECYTPAWNGEETTDEENWLRIDKPIRPELPGTPADCQHWFDPAELDDVSSEPKLYDEIVDPKWISSDREDGDESDSTPPPNLLLSDHPHVFSAWEEYLERKWRPLRTQYQRWEPVQRAYRKLFAIYQEQQRRGEQYELLLGVGVLLWITASEHKGAPAGCNSTCDDLPSNLPLAVSPLLQQSMELISPLSRTCWRSTNGRQLRINEKSRIGFRRSNPLGIEK